MEGATGILFLVVAACTNGICEWLTSSSTSPTSKVEFDFLEFPHHHWHCTTTVSGPILPNQHLLLCIYIFNRHSNSSNNASASQMTSRPMSKLSTAAACSSASAARLISPPVRTAAAGLAQRCKSTTAGSGPPRQVLPRRSLAQVRPEPISEIWFTSSYPRSSSQDDLLGNASRPGDVQDNKPPDERLIKLGKSWCSNSSIWIDQ